MKIAALGFIAPMLIASTALTTLAAPAEARLHCRRHGPCHQVVAPQIDLRKHGRGIHFMRCRHGHGHLGRC